jgi:[protein-PII] uridylyltransferase
MLEPNVKEGKGGLRDLQTLYWIAKYEHGVAGAAESGEILGVFRPEEFEAFDEAERFLWAVRCHLHLIADRAQDQLTVSTCRSRSRNVMGYQDHSGRRGVEHFMQDYFRHATRVGELTRIFLTELEARHVKQANPRSWASCEDVNRRKRSNEATRQTEPPDDREAGGFLHRQAEHAAPVRGGLRTGYLIHPDAMRRFRPVST